MHYYQFNIADYRKDTSHLTPIEHYIYRFLMDWAYLDEQPIPLDTTFVLRKLNLTSKHLSNLENVLNDFFKKSDFGWYQKRINESIAEYHNYLNKQSINGKKGGRPKKPTANPPITQIEPKKSLTTNHKPITNKETLLPEDFAISERVISWANQRGYRDLEKHFDHFVILAQAKGYKYTDWDAAFMNAIRNNWAKVASKEVRLSL